MQGRRERIESREVSSEKHVETAEVADGEAGSEVEEQSMELATPLHPTILSLADDDLLIPPPIPPSLASSTSTRATVEPSDIPLPISPSLLVHPAPSGSLIKLDLA